MHRITMSLAGVLCSSTVMAGYVVEQAPSWRGDENTATYVWEDFTSADATAPNVPNNEPFPSGNALLFNFGDGAIISGDSNIYGFGGPLNIHTYGYTQTDAQEVVFNVSTLGSMLDLESAMFAWNDGTDDGDSGLIMGNSSINYMEEVDFGQGTGYILNVSWSFDLTSIDADVREFGLIWQSFGPHTSLDTTTMDVRFLAVPAPGALALIGLAGLHRRRRRI